MQFDRRGFITLLGGAAAWPLAARAQQPALTLGRLADSPADVLAARGFDQAMRHDFASSLNRSTPGAAGFLILS